MSEYNLICRICLLQTKNLKRIDCKMFRYCIGIDISKSSSSSVCENCNKCLNDSFTFRKKCIDAYFNIQMREYKIEVLTDDISDNIIETCVKEEIEDDMMTGPPDLIYPVKEEMFTRPPDIIYPAKEDIKVEEIETEPISELNWDDINTNIESDSDYFLSEEETFMQQILKIPKNIKFTKKQPPESKKRGFHLCYICGVSRSIKSSFHQHMKTHAANPKDPKSRVSCDQCDKTYKSKDHLNTHTRVHHKNIRAFACTQCDKTFTYWSSRKFHMVAAHGVEPKYNCQICPYKTQNSNRFKDHMNQHQGLLPFECDICEKKFLNSRQLKAHEIVHTRTRDQICSYCNKAFGTLKSLKAHIKIHTQERNYVCPVESCSKDFIQNHVLKSHMRANHPEIEIPPSGTIVSKKSKDMKLHGTIQRNCFEYSDSE